MLTIEEGKRYLGIMPAVVQEAMGVKLVSFYPGNAGTGLPTHFGIILLSRSDTGEPLAVMDGRLITEMRTAAVSAAVTKHLAAPESHVLALLGSGVQASAHWNALLRVRQFDDIRIWSRKPEHAQRFADKHDVRAIASVESAVRNADVIVTATNATEPLLKGSWVKEGALVVAVGSPRPTWRELYDDVMISGVLVVELLRGSAQGIGRRYSFQSADLRRGWGDLYWHEEKASARQHDRVQVGRHRGRGHRGRKARIRSHSFLKPTRPPPAGAAAAARIPDLLSA